ncbi:Non-reducing end beta-L-arabinofuranosidase [Colletotrichum fructicola]|nr:Non-reducing end beta-L-arabinofuranosidase [Colletotrichum fructicola]
MASTERFNKDLVPFKYELYPLGAIKPSGWFSDQLRLSAKGLGGNLFHFYRFVKESTWLGGSWEYTPLNEAAPYWYNYIVPLAYTLDRDSDSQLFLDLKKQADYFLDYTLEHQAEDGWLGPETTSHTRGIWARCLLLQGLMNHAIADPSRRATILEAVLRFVRLVRKMLKNNYEGYIPQKDDVFDLQLFGVARAHELALTLQWLYYQPESSSDRHGIWEVMDLMWQGSRIMERDWTKFFGEDFPKTPSVRYKSLNFKHGVNVAQGLRYPAHLYRMEPSDDLASLCRDAVKKTFDYHGTAAGSISSDEYIGGLSPQRGSELCCSVELMFSISYLYQLFGDNHFADMVESAAFNAVPAGISADWWSHQYITQVNQPWAKELELPEGEKTPFYDVCRYANVFGLEPEFPCCTVNHPTAYSKLLMNAFLWKQTPKGMTSIIHAYLIPSRLETEDITINCDSNYPFAPCALRYSISTSKPFKLLIRVPDWASPSSTIEFKGSGSLASAKPQPFIQNTEDSSGHVHKIDIPAAGDFDVFVTIHAEVRVQKHENGSVSIHYGPLLYAYEIDFKTETRLPRNYKDQASECTEISSVANQDEEPWMTHTRDHDYLPTADWNIAIDPTQGLEVVVHKGPWEQEGDRKVSELPNPVWNSGASPVHLEVSAAWVSWPTRNGTAADPLDVEKKIQSQPFRAKLVPYATAKLHIAQFPVVDTTS